MNANLEFAGVTYAGIHHSISTLDLPSLTSARTLVPEPGGRLGMVIRIYRGVRPILGVVAALPLIPQDWRTAMGLFIGALDGLAAEVTPDFKAGKDL